MARWFENQLPDNWRMTGVLRQQILVHKNIPYTSHNSAACVVIDAPDASVFGIITERAAQHVRQFFLEGSDPGICVAIDGDFDLSDLMQFGRECTPNVMTQKDALNAAQRVHLSGLGGTKFKPFLPGISLERRTYLKGANGAP